VYLYEPNEYRIVCVAETASFTRFLLWKLSPSSRKKERKMSSEKKSIAQGASTYGTTAAGNSNSNDNSFEDDDTYDPYAMRLSTGSSSKDLPSTKYDSNSNTNNNKSFPLRRRKLMEHLSKWRLNARKKRSERSALENFVIDWTLPIFACYIAISMFILMTDPNEPQINGSFIKAFYFVAITIMAIGYGDYYPVSNGGKIYIMVLILTGIVIIASVFDRLTIWFLVKAKDVRGTLEERRNREIEEDLVTLRQAIVSSQQMKSGDDFEPNLLQKGSHTKSTQKVNEDIEKMKSASVWYAVGMLVVVVFSGAAIFHALEGHTYLDCIYWAVVTTTTVGYGDIYPVTDAGRLFTCAYGLCSIGLVTYSLSLIAKNTLYQSLEDESAVESFQLTAQTLIDIGGKKGYASEYDFLVAMLLASGKIEPDDVEEIRKKFMRLDINGDKQLDYRDLLGGDLSHADGAATTINRAARPGTPERKLIQND